MIDAKKQPQRMPTPGIPTKVVEGATEQADSKGDPLDQLSTLDNIDDADLVHLDGTSIDWPKQKQTPLGMDPQLVSDRSDSFAPPTFKEAPIELDESLPLVSSSGKMAESQSIAEEDGLSIDLDEGRFSSCESTPSSRSQSNPRFANATPIHLPVVPPKQEDFRNRSQPPHAEAERTSSAARATIQRPSSQYRGGHVGGIQNFFSDRPKTRILLGFILAMGFSFFIPLIYKSTIVSPRLQPMLQELSDARHAVSLALPLGTVRSPDKVESTISAFKLRQGIFSLILWMGVAGGIGYIWNRFTRSD